MRFILLSNLPTQKRKYFYRKGMSLIQWKGLSKSSLRTIRKGRQTRALRRDSPLSRFGEFYYCRCLSLLPKLACSIHATWCIDFSRSLYMPAPRAIAACCRRRFHSSVDMRGRIRRGRRPPPRSRRGSRFRWRPPRLVGLP